MSLQNSLPHCALSELIAQRQPLIGKTDQQLAQELGFTHANTFTMVKEGRLKLPFNQIEQLAVAIDCPALVVLKAVLQDYAPELFVLVEKVWAKMEH